MPQTSKMDRGGMSTAMSGGKSSSTEGSSTNFSFERAAGAGCGHSDGTAIDEQSKHHCQAVPPDIYAYSSANEQRQMQTKHVYQCD